MGYVQNANEHFVELTRSKFGNGKRLTVAYEEIRLYLSSPLLQELVSIVHVEQGKKHQVPMDEEVESVFVHPFCLLPFQEKN